jgi:hypothetical protein
MARAARRFAPPGGFARCRPAGGTAPPAWPKAPFPSSRLLSPQGSEAVKGGALRRRSEPLTASLPCV